MKLILIYMVSMFLPFALAHAQSPVVAGEYIVKMKAQTGLSANSRISKGLSLVSKLGSSVKVKQAFWGSTMMHIRSDSQASIESLRANPEVEFVEPNYILSLEPNDIEAFGVPPQNTDTYSQSGTGTQVTQSWNIAKPYNQGTKTVVAVIDTGLDTTHGLFRDSGAIWENTAEKNGVAGVDDDGNGYIDDINGWNYVANSNNVYDDDDHGTHVAGIVLGVGQDILQSGVRESKIKIMPLKFLDASGSGTTASAVNAIYYAVNMGAKVINNSWGGSSYSKSLHDAYTYAHSHGVFIASAAGNGNAQGVGQNNDVTAMYPANLDTPNNMAVAATTDSNTKTSFSNYGSLVQVGAPGLSIISSVPGTGCSAPGCFQIMSGTSMAAPFVAGMAALILREAPQLSGYQVKNIIISSVDLFASLNNYVSSKGRVNVYKAIQNAQTQTGTANYNPSYSPVYKSERGLASDSEAAAKGCGLVKAVQEVSDSSGNGPSNRMGSNIAVMFLMILLPLSLAFSLRKKAEAPANAGLARRKFARYNLAKDLVVQIGDQVVNVASETLSLGGLSFNSTEAMQINKGEKIRVKIVELDHEVEGEVVWCSAKQSYGVKFLTISDQLKDHFASWTVGLSPT